MDRCKFSAIKGGARFEFAGQLFQKMQDNANCLGHYNATLLEKTSWGRFVAGGGVLFGQDTTVERRAR